MTDTQLDKDFILNVHMQDYETFRTQFTDQSVFKNYGSLFDHIEFAHRKMSTKYTTSESRKHKLDYQYKNIMQVTHCTICANLGNAIREQKFELPIFDTQTKVDLYRGVVQHGYS